MWKARRNKRFTSEEVEQLASNPFTYRVSACQISYTLEFKNLFLARYEAGESVREIFQSLGYDIEILGESRIYCFAHQLVKRAEEGQLMREGPPSRREKKPANINYNTMPSHCIFAPAVGICKKNYRTGQWRKAEQMIMGKASAKFEVIHEIMIQEGNLQNVQELCRIAGVSRSGYYNWIANESNRIAREQRDRQDFERILEAYHYRGYAKGIRGIHMRLLHMDPPVLMNLKKIRRLMGKYGLACPIRKANPYRRMAKAMKSDAIAANLLNREFEKYGPRKVLLTDITYIPCCGKFFYLSVILDAFTKQVLAYVFSNSLEVDFVLETVHILMKNHGVSLDVQTLIHSDQGCHYTCKKFRQIVSDSGLRQSMSRRGNCWDNAPQESFFGHMKDEVGAALSLATSFEDAKAMLDDWMDYYNTDRGQWQLAKLSPNEFFDYYTTGIYPLVLSPSSTQPHVE